MKEKLSNKKSNIHNQQSYKNRKYIKGFYDLYNSENGKALQKFEKSKIVSNDLESCCPRLCFGFYDINDNNPLFEIMAIYEYKNNSGLSIIFNSDDLYFVDWLTDDLKRLSVFDNTENKLNSGNKGLYKLKDFLICLGYKDLTQYDNKNIINDNIKKEVFEISESDKNYYDNLLTLDKLRDDKDSNSIIFSKGIKFNDNFEMEIKLSAGHENYFIDFTLFDSEGYEINCGFPSDDNTILGEYLLDYNGMNYLVEIKLKK